MEKILELVVGGGNKMIKKNVDCIVNRQRDKKDKRDLRDQNINITTSLSLRAESRSEKIDYEKQRLFR